MFSAGCISKEVQETEIVGDVGYSVGYASENQNNLQKIHWTVSIVNKGVKKAEDVRVDVILHHAVVSSGMIDEGMALGLAIGLVFSLI